jgi:hypothetical protein
MTHNQRHTETSADPVRFTLKRHFLLKCQDIAKRQRLRHAVPRIVKALAKMPDNTVIDGEVSRPRQ